MRLLFLSLPLLCACTSAVDLSVGKRCDSSHPCDEGRTCLSGRCADPSTLKGTPDLCLKVSDQPNLVPNPGFETDLAGWEGESSGKLQRGDGGLFSAWAMQVTDPDDSSFGVNDSPTVVPRTPATGQRYCAVAWVRAEQSSGPVALLFAEYDPSDVLLQKAYSEKVTPGADWAPLFLEYTTQGPPDSFLDFHLMSDAPLSSGESFFVDEISIRTQ